jgi:hypothetical protein
MICVNRTLRLRKPSTRALSLPCAPSM